MKDWKDIDEVLSGCDRPADLLRSRFNDSQDLLPIVHSADCQSHWRPCCNDMFSGSHSLKRGIDPHRVLVPCKLRFAYLAHCGADTLRSVKLGTEGLRLAMRQSQALTALSTSPIAGNPRWYSFQRKHLPAQRGDRQHGRGERHR